MNTYIYGAGVFGRKLIELIDQHYKDICVEAILDKKKAGSIEGRKIISPDALFEENICVIIALSKYEIAVEVYKELYGRGIRNIWWFYRENEVVGKSFYDDQCVDCRKWTGGAILQVEMHIMDSCNLNCRGCSHFSPIFDRSLPDFDSRINDVKKLSEKIAYIHEFYILGGEPFLNPDIGRYSEKIRELLPETNIYIVTNGLLIPKVSDEVLIQIRESNVKISISEYKPVHGAIERIKEKLERNQIDYELRPIDDKMMFNRPLSISENSGHQRLCISYPCVTIWNGNISRCPTLMYIGRFNEYFGVSLPDEGIISLDDELAGWDLIDTMENEVPLCNHCIKDDIPWGICGNPPRLDDFAVLD